MFLSFLTKITSTAAGLLLYVSCIKLKLSVGMLTIYSQLDIIFRVLHSVGT